MALGGAPFIQLVQFLPKVRAGHYNFVIVDTTPNDEIYYSKMGHERFYKKLYYEFLSTISVGSKTVVLQLPTERHVNEKHSIRLAQAAIVSSLGGYFLDVSAFVSEKSALRPQGLRVHSDNFHLHRPIAYSIGASLARCLVAAENGQNTNATDFIGHFDMIAGTPSTNKTERVQTSLVDEEFRSLTLHDRIDFDCERLCLGFFNHSGGCNSYLHLSGSDGARYLSMFYKPDEHRNVVRFQPVRHGFLTKRVSVARPEDLYDVAFQSDVLHLQPYRAAVGNFIVYDGDPTEQTWRGGAPTDAADLAPRFSDIGSAPLREVLLSLTT